MQLHTFVFRYSFLILLGVIFFSACGPGTPRDKHIIADPDKMDQNTAENIRVALDFSLQNNGKVDDSLLLVQPGIVSDFYKTRDYSPIWCSKEKWEPLADSLYDFIINARLSGLYPNDYFGQKLKLLKDKLDHDSLQRMDAALWTRADLMFTDGFMHIIRDLKQGRLKTDSLTLSKDSSLDNNFYTGNLKTLLANQQFTSLLNSLEPRHKGYWELKKGIPAFLDSMDNKTYTYIKYPYKKGDSRDSTTFVRSLRQRLQEAGVMEISAAMPDTAQLKAALKKIQQQKGLTADGKISTALIRSLNTSDAERFKRIAITLDRYKQLPEKMPEKYIWVNLPGYYLRVMDHDTLALESKIICGKPDTRTPLLTSRITDMVTYPTWTVPTSIIVKSYLPKLKNNPNYISKIGLKLMNNKGESVDPSSISWSKYSRGIPFKVMQASGDNNALGIFKFNFNNPYAVYLHDTNQRYLFKNSVRALSHGCVRVQEWEKLAFYISKNDSINSPNRENLKYNTDSIRHWIARKVNRRIDVRNQVPLFIRYFSCEGKQGKIQFYDDIYGEDRLLREKYFANK